MSTPHPPPGGAEGSGYSGDEGAAVVLARAVREVVGLLGAEGVSAATVSRAMRVLDAAEPSAAQRRDLQAGLASFRADILGQLVDTDLASARVRDDAIVERRRAVGLTAPGDPQLPMRHSNLAAELTARFAEQSDPQDLVEAIALLDEVLAAIAPDDPGRPVRAGNLAAALTERFRITGSVHDLERAISIWRGVCVRGTASGQADNQDTDPARINLAGALRSSFDVTGQATDLDEAEQLERDVLERTGNVTAAAGLGTTLLRRYEAGGEGDLVSDAVALLDAAVRATKGSAPARLTRETNLANALLARFELRGDRADLDRAVDLLTDVLADTSPDARDRASRASNLGGALRRRAARWGDTDDLDRAIAAYEEAADATPAQHSQRFAFANNLANGLRDRYQRTGSLADLDRAIELFAEATTADHTGGHRAVLLAGLGVATAERARRRGSAQGFDDAVTAFEAALDATPPGAVARSRQELNLANALHERTQFGTARPNDIDRAVALSRRAVQGAQVAQDQDTPSGSARQPGTVDSGPGLAVDTPRAWNMLGVVLSARWADGGPDHRLEAVAAAHQAVQASAPGTADHAEYTANLALFLSELPDPEPQEVGAQFAEAVAQAEAVNLPAALFTASNWARWQEDRGDWSGATAAYRHGLDAMERLQSSQEGRAHRESWLTSAQGLAARAAYSAVRDPYGSAADAFALLQRGQAVLLRAALTEPMRTSVTQQKAAVEDADPTVPEEVTAEGPVVAVAATRRGGVALVVARGEPVAAVALPRLTSDRVTAWATTLSEPRPGRIGPVLAEVWQDVMAPIVDHCPPGLRALTLLAAGTVRMLPLHAAGSPGDGYLCERVRMSSAPNISALRSAYRHRDRPAKRLLAVGDPSGTTDADGWELRQVLEGFRDTVVRTDRAATVAEVLTHLDDVDVAHFCCHGFADPDAPALSGLRLADGTLTVGELLARPRRSQPARLAVLSACESARIGRVLADEAVSLPTALAQVGFGGVLGTLWRVPDESAGLLVAAFYDAWRTAGLPPAEALRQAQTKIRGLTNAELLDLRPDLLAVAAARVPALAHRQWERAHRYADPYHWAAFVYVGA